MTIKVLEIDLIKVVEHVVGNVRRYYNYNHFMYEYRNISNSDDIIETVIPTVSYYKKHNTYDYIKPIGYDCLIHVNLTYDLGDDNFFATNVIDILYCEEYVYQKMLNDKTLIPNNITKNIKALDGI